MTHFQDKDPEFFQARITDASPDELAMLRSSVEYKDHTLATGTSSILSQVRLDRAVESIQKTMRTEFGFDLTPGTLWRLGDIAQAGIEIGLFRVGLAVSTPENFAVNACGSMFSVVDLVHSFDLKPGNQGGHAEIAPDYKELLVAVFAHQPTAERIELVARLTQNTTEAFIEFARVLDEFLSSELGRNLPILHKAGAPGASFSQAEAFQHIEKSLWYSENGQAAMLPEEQSARERIHGNLVEDTRDAVDRMRRDQIARILISFPEPFRGVFIENSSALIRRMREELRRGDPLYERQLAAAIVEEEAEGVGSPNEQYEIALCASFDILRNAQAQLKKVLDPRVPGILKTSAQNRVEAAQTTVQVLKRHRDWLLKHLPSGSSTEY